MSHVLTAEGSSIAMNGSHEARVWSALPTKEQRPPLTPKELERKIGSEVAKIGQGRAFKNKWIVKEGDGLVRLTESIDDSTQKDMREVDSTGTLKAGEKALAELRKRKLIVPKKGQWFTVHKGSNFSTSTAKPETDLTVDMLTSTPAREVQDTFYLSDPSTSLPPPADYYARVSKVHEHGGFGSSGYRAPWSDAESRKLLLRTHTTASSAAMLYKLAARCRGEDDLEADALAAHSGTTRKGKESDGGDGFRPAKLFSIDRVFRNETMDATHLAEFHQVEGVVADRDLTLADLIGFMRVFFKKMGLENIRFKPAYNPYTEPSLEIFAFHPQLRKWVEVGNSGMFRPEMLEPMGFPKDVHVHGWGIGLERPTMIRYGISNIRTLVGHKVPIENVEKSPAVRF
ncbi:hypothetical protein EW026_g415 [Hermanssonia centrifuga]|uniref:phenylalanine--tRNA ligase n=1 Tax=Hermanssonia centrifuga TaxID=98765 RepID=A0A4S4KV51_9APHY|nr:hypothetical protein EW026_g415 [Hermanssonia centrifuga]